MKEKRKDEKGRDGPGEGSARCFPGRTCDDGWTRVNDGSLKDVEQQDDGDVRDGSKLRDNDGRNRIDSSALLKWRDRQGNAGRILQRKELCSLTFTADTTQPNPAAAVALTIPRRWALFGPSFKKKVVKYECK